VRQPIPAEPGQLERYDYEYRRDHRPRGIGRFGIEVERTSSMRATYSPSTLGMRAVLLPPEVQREVDAIMHAHGLDSNLFYEPRGRWLTETASDDKEFG
jgi:hypothetical protein